MAASIIRCNLVAREKSMKKGIKDHKNLVWIFKLIVDVVWGEFVVVGVIFIEKVEIWSGLEIKKESYI